MKFKSYLIESGIMDREYDKSRTQSIDKDQAIELINKNCKANFTKLSSRKRGIYRGIYPFKSAFGYVNTNKGTPRKSANTLNYITLLMDNLPSWKDYPERSRSIICSTEYDTSDAYGNVYRVIPYNNANIGICPQYDIWDSFMYIKPLNRFNHMFNMLLNEYNLNADDDDWNTFKRSLIELDKEYDSDYVMNKSDNKYTYQRDEAILNMIFNEKDIIKNFDNILNPKVKDFEMGINNLNDNVEVWIQGECILINESLFKGFEDLL